MLNPVIDRDELLERATHTETLREVGNIAAATLLKYYGIAGAGLAMGPIRNGGIIVGNRPSIKKNIDKLRKSILALQTSNDEGIPVFDQLLFKPAIDKHLARWRERDKSHASGYYDAILHDFYAPIVETGAVAVVFLLPHSKNSRTCRYVRNRLGTHAKFVTIQ